jgi:hypothetical protein
MNTQDSTHHTAKGLQSLAEAVGRARAADVVRLVDAALLRRLLLALAACTKAAEHALVPTADSNVSPQADLQDPQSFLQSITGVACCGLTTCRHDCRAVALQVLDAVAAIFASMDATVTILGIASAAGVPRHAVPEEALDQVRGPLERQQRLETCPLGEASWPRTLRWCHQSVWCYDLG